MSTQPRSSSGGVRNLRAMFEQKDESSTSPPDRGRSPAGSYVGGGNNGVSPRPLSKVRTSFVAVERSGQFGGQLGLRMPNEADQSQGRRKTSFSIDEEADSLTMDEKPSMVSDLKVKKNNVGMRGAAPEHAIAETPPLESTSKTGYMNGHRVNGSVPVAKTNGGADKNAEKKGTSAISASDATPVVGVKPSSPIKLLSKAGPTKEAIKPAPISTAKASASSKSSSAGKSPAIPKTPTTSGVSGKPVSSRPTASKSAENKSPERKVVKPVKIHEAVKHAARPSTAASTSSKATKRPAPAASATGFVKPRPKSPTKPAKLPASLTTHTASSQSKVSSGSTPPRQRSLVPNASAKVNLKTVSRSPSRVNLAKTELRRTKSSIHGERPALGRPPSVRDHTSRQSLPKQIVSTDEGFLARMMRPTTSSASKVLEKPFTPPRERPKSNTRPQTRDSAVSHKTDEGQTEIPSTKNLPHVPNNPKVEAPKMTKLETVEPVTAVESTASARSDSRTSDGLKDLAKVRAGAVSVEEKATKHCKPPGEDLEDVIPSTETMSPKAVSSIPEEKKKSDGFDSLCKEGPVSEPNVPIDWDKIEVAGNTKLKEPKEIKKGKGDNGGVNEAVAKDVDPIEEKVANFKPIVVSDSKVELKATGEEPETEISGQEETVEDSIS